MRTLLCLFLLSVIGYRGTEGQVISQPDDGTICEGEGAVFTCVLNGNITSDDVQWYRFIKDTSTTEMIDPNGENINFITRTNASLSTVNNGSAINNGSTVNNGSATPISNGNIIRNTSLTITNAIKSYTGYFWVETPSLNVCNVSLTVGTSPPALTVNIMKNIESLSIVVQWDAVDDSLPTTYTITWTDEGDHLNVTTVIEQTSYTITGLTLDTVYIITVTPANGCGGGPEFSTSISFSIDTTSTTSTISPTVTARTNPMTIISTVNPNNITTTTAGTDTVTTMNNPTITTTNSAFTTDSGNDGTTTKTTSVKTTTTIRTYDATITTTSINPSTTTATTTDESSDSNIAVIAGAAVGGIIVAIIIVSVIFIIICCLRRNKNTEKNSYNDLSGDGTLNKNIPMVPNPLDTNHEHDKPGPEPSHQISTTVEGLYMTSDIGNKKPPHLYNPLEPAAQKRKTDTQHQQSMEYAVIDDSKKKDQKGDKQQNGETDQPMEYAITVVDKSKKNKKGNKQQSGETAQHQPMEYAVVDKSKKKNRKKDKQQNVDDAHSDVPTVTVPSIGDHTSDSANQNKNNPLLHYAELETLPAPTGAYTAKDDSRTPYALVS